MILGTKAMIAGCIERVAQSGCGGCEGRDACASLFKARGWARPREERRSGSPSPFLAFLDKIARGFEPPKPRESAFRHQIESRLEPMLAGGPIGIADVARELGLSR